MKVIHHQTQKSTSVCIGASIDTSLLWDQSEHQQCLSGDLSSNTSTVEQNSYNKCFQGSRDPYQCEFAVVVVTFCHLPAEAS